MERIISEFQIELLSDSSEQTYLRIGANQNLVEKNEKAEELFDKIASIPAEYGSKEGCVMAVQKIAIEIAKLQENKEETARRISSIQQQRSALTLELTGAASASSNKHLPIGLRGLDREHKKLMKLQKQFDDLRLTLNPQLASVEIRKIKELGLSTRRQDGESSK